MQTSREYIQFFFNIIRCFPHLLLFYFHKNKSLIQADVKNSLAIMNKQFQEPFGLIYLLAFCKHFRNLFYYRTRPYSHILNIFCPQLQTLMIQTKNIGGGLSIVNGFATAIGAKSIGKNCIIYQQVTLGGNKYGSPVIMDNVTIYSGAIIIGKVTIGKNVVIGANSTVFHSIPDNCSVLPAASMVMKWKNHKAD